MASGGVRVDESIACALTGSGLALERLLGSLAADGAYQAVQVAPDRLQFARTFRPTWAIVAGVVTLPLALLGVFFFLVKTTETCLAVVEADHRGTRVRLSGKLSSSALGRVRSALTDGSGTAMYASDIGAPVANAFEAGVAPVAAVAYESPPLIDLRAGAAGHPTPLTASGSSLSLLPPPVGAPVAIFGTPPVAAVAHHAPPAVQPAPPVFQPAPSVLQPAPFEASPAASVHRFVAVHPEHAEPDGATVMAPHRPPEAAPVPVLTVDTGQREVLTAHNLLGRDPAGGPDDVNPQLIAVADQSRSVSKTHLSVSYRDGGWYVVDRHSTNGAALVGPDGTERPLRPGEPTEVPMGSSVRFGERIFQIVAEAAS